MGKQENSLDIAGVIRRSLFFLCLRFRSFVFQISFSAKTLISAEQFLGSCRHLVRLEAELFLEFF